MVDGSVMVSFISNKVNTFVLLEINCKIISLGSAKSPFIIFYARLIYPPTFYKMGGITVLEVARYTL